jgi:hypothetical protein
MHEELVKENPVEGWTEAVSIQKLFVIHAIYLTPCERIS